MQTKYEQAKTDRQKYVQNILNSASSRRVVVAGPGTGKTYLFKQVLEQKTNALTLTFVNSLVEDLSLELNGMSEVRTLHSFARKLLGSLSGKAVDIFSKLPQVVAEDAHVLLQKEIDFERIFRQRDDANEAIDFYRTRKKYYGNYYGHSDVIFAVVKYLEKHSEKVPQYDQVVVDEFQDFNKLEVSLIDLLALRSPVLIAGDDDQAVYLFKDASPDHIRSRHCDSGLGYEPFTLPYCSRSTKVIVDAVNDLVQAARKKGLLQKRIPKRYVYFEEHSKDIMSAQHPKITHCRTFHSQVAWCVERQINELALGRKQAFTVLTISPTRAKASALAEALRKKGFKRVDCADKSDSESAILIDGLKLLMKDRHANLGWRICAKHLLLAVDFESLLRKTSEDPNCTVLDLLKCSHREVVRDVKCMLAALRKVQDDAQLDEECVRILQKAGIDSFTAIKEALQKDMDTAGRSANAAVKNIPITATTIQSSKGLAADYVFITHFDDKYFIKDKNRVVIDQDVCNFLVALTRARNKVHLVSTEATNPMFLTWINGDRVELQDHRLSKKKSGKSVSGKDR